MLQEHYISSGISTDEGAADESWRRTKMRAISLWGRAARGASGRPSSGYLEAFLGVAIVSAAGVMIPGHWGLLTLYPHPLWIVVLAIAIRYGAPSGYVAGGLAAISQCLSLWIRPGGASSPSPHTRSFSPSSSSSSAW